MGYVDMILGGVAGSVADQQRELLEVVRRNTDRLARLIGDLLDIERIQSRRMDLQWREVSLVDAVRQATETLALSAAEKGLDFELALPEQPLPAVWGDYDRLVQVAVRETGDSLELVVTDTGIGMNPELQQRAFEKFVRGREQVVRQTSGTGLGLSIVRALVDAHQGVVSLESESGRGTRVTVTLPSVRLNRGAGPLDMES